MKKIVLFGSTFDDNLGEDIFPRCFKAKFLECGDEQFEFTSLDMYGRSEKVNCQLSADDNRDYKKMIARKAAKKAFNLMGSPNVYRHITWLLKKRERIRLASQYEQKIEGASAIVVAGGGILECTGQHDFYHHVDLLTSIAEKRDIPVYFNAVGVVVDHKLSHMFGWSIMGKALARKCVKSITCRDGAEWVNERMFHGGLVARTLPCSAIFASEVFDIQKDEKSKLIGIGVIRGNAFESYGKPVSQEYLLDIYEDVIRKLIDHGHKCEIFTNGLGDDEKFASLLQARFKEGVVSKAARSTSAEQLLNTIASYRGIITARLHAAISAYSLKVPSVALVWNPKVAEFMKMIGNGNCAIEVADFEASHIVGTFEEELETGYDMTIYEDLRGQVNRGVQAIYDDIEE